MSNTRTTEQMFLSQTDRCPFCESSLLEKTSSISYRDKKETTLYDYNCGLQVKVFTEIINEEEVTRLDSQQCCSSRTIALETVLTLKEELKNK